MWIRKFRLELTGGVTQTFEDLRIDFAYYEHFKVGEFTNMADICDIQIFNLGVDRMKTLVTDKEVKVQLFAGYADEDELSLIFEGVVTNVQGRRALPEHITTLYCIPKGLALANKPVKYEGKREDTVLTVIKELSKQLGLRVSVEGAEDKVEIPYRAKSIQDVGITALTDIGEQHYFMPRIEGEELRIIPIAESATAIDKLPKVHTLDMKLIRGVPQAGVATMSIPYALNTRIRTGHAIDTTNLTGTEESPNGVTDISGLGKGSLHYSDTLHRWAITPKYQIIKAVHLGSNYTDEFVSTYECVTYINNRKGDT